MRDALLERTHGGLAQAAIRDAQFSPIADPPARPATWIVAAVVVVLIASLAYLAGSRGTPGVALATAEASPARAADAPVATAPPSPAEALPTEAPPDTAPAADSAAAAETPPADRLSERLAASEDWLRTVPDTHYFIQLFNADAKRAREVSHFLENNALDPRELRVYRSKLSGRDRFGVIYGDYPSAAEASADLARVAKISRIGKPYIRSVSKLR